jgi:glycosyltransferase involved in cell wall biosynthesis
MLLIMTQHKSKIRVLALIYPIEEHVGHWACSSDRLAIHRIIMVGPDLQAKIVHAIKEFDPEVIAICGKAAIEYLDILDNLASKVPSIAKIPRVFRMQNSSLLLQSAETVHSKQLCRDLSLWFRLACDPRWSWIFVQTLNDIDLVRNHLLPIPVSACPYGYDTAVFDPQLPELERNVDVGCYMNLRDDPGRHELVARVETICRRKSWSFQFVEGVYWHEYARQIRTSKIVLHRSIYSEVPYRMYETLVFGTVFVTDPLKAQVEELFEEDREYMTYKKDFSNLEDVLERLLTNDSLLRSIGENGRSRARQYTWPAIADKYVAPALVELLNGENRPPLFPT